MKSFIPITAFVLLLQAGKAQLSAESIIGSHAGYNTWEKLPVALEIKDNFVYEIKTYNYLLEGQNTIRGTWEIEGDKIILTDVIGGTTVLQKNKDVFYLVAQNGVTCMARFYQNKNLQEYWKTFKSGSGC
jgi:hypothetical protein